MSNPSPNNVFTAADIERYHAGKMSAAEMHALEKAALEDPFLADALEGYTYTTSAQADLASIRERLTPGKEKRRGIIPFFRHNAFMRAAAIILLVAGAGLLVTQLATNNKKEVAVTSAGKQEADDFQSRTTMQDSAFLSPQQEMQSGVTPPEEESSSTFNYSTAPTRVATARPENPPTLQKTEIEADATAIAGQAAAVPRTMAAKEQGLLADSINRQSASDLAGVEMKGDTIRNLVIVLQENNQALEEVVVLERKQNKALQKTKPFEEMEPIGGWEGFNNYALNNLKQPAEMKDKPNTGDVVLSFDTNQSGEPVNIKVVESQCETCEAEAKRILMQGPKWKNKNSRNARIRIRF